MSVSLPERSQISACVFVLGLLCHSSLLLNAQSQASPQTKERQIRVQEPLRTASASRIDLAPKLDGTLDDPIWQQASAIDNFLQREPFEGQPSTEKTEVRILYSKHEVYFGITCSDSDPKRIVATELRRDVSQELDDYFEIIIDSAHDRRNAYVFQINPLGTQRDALITEEQRTDTSTGDGDPGWDGVWTSEARITKQGWTATVAIPFSTLNFMRSRDVIWGINFKRFIRRKNEEDLWSGWRRTYGAARISQAGQLQGISEIGSGRLFIVKPYGLVGFSHFPSSAAGTGLTPGISALYTGGVDVKLGLRSNLVANLTANTDFADADVDTQQFNLTPYKNLVVNGYATQTRTPGFSSGQTNLGAGFNYQANWLEVFAQHRKVGPNFNPEVGFLERTDCICNYLDVTFKPRPKLRGVRELNFEGFVFHAPDTRHVLQTQEWQNTFRIDFNNGSYSDDDIVDVFTQRLITPFNIYKNIFIPVDEYHWTRHQLTYGSPQDRRLMVSFFERFGTYYNGHLNEARVRATYRANERWSFNFAEQWNRFKLGIVTGPAGAVLPAAAGDFSVVFGSFQTNYSFSRFLTLSTLIQMDTANNQAASANIRLRWNYRPDSDLYVIYTAGQRFASLVASNPPQFYENRLT